MFGIPYKKKKWRELTQTKWTVKQKQEKKRKYNGKTAMDKIEVEEAMEIEYMKAPGNVLVLNERS